MRRVALGLAATALLLGACNNAKSVVVPSDPSTWDEELAPKIKALSEEDKAIFGRYIVRVTLENALGGKPAIPPGVTVGKAIEDQKAYEADQEKAKAEAATAQAKAAALQAAAIAKLNQTASVTLASKTFRPSNAMAGRYSDVVAFTFAVNNKGAKPISGIKGRFRFEDQFGDLIKELNLSMDENIAANQTQLVSGYSMDVNQFMDDDVKLANTDFSKLKATFIPEMIVFADGTRLSAETAPTEAGA